MSVKAKIVFEHDIRLWRCEEQDNLYESLVSFVKSAFHFTNEKNFHLQYEDDEGDRVTISSNVDIIDSLSMANGKSLKIYVVKETEQFPDEISTQEKIGESENEEKSANLIGNNETRNPDICTLDREIVLKFLQDATIRKLLPDFVKEILTNLRKNPSLEKVVQDILKDKKYLPITGHELFQNVIVKNLSFVIQRGQFYVPILLSFSEDFLISNLSGLIDYAIEAATTFNNVDCEFLFNPAWNGFFKCFMRCDERNEKNDESVHNNITCDICNSSPIRGIRYKCAICPDFDLCSKCDSQNNHDPSHPLIKFTQPFSGFPPAHFLGIHELFHRNWGAHHPSGHWFRPPHVPPMHPPMHHPMFSQRCPYRSRRCSKGDYPKNKCGNWRRRNSDKSSDSDGAIIDAQFICDVNLPDGSYCAIDTIMNKIWKMKNNTTQEWGNNVELIFIKGNESLTLENRFPVPNVKPGEEVEVTAMIQTPKLPGRYCAYYQLSKNGNKFGPQIWVDINAIEDDDIPNEDASKQQEQNIENKNVKKVNEIYEVSCVCGVPLILTTPCDAYQSVDVRVYCDGCNKSIEPRGSVFHCINERSSQHPNCYDLCLKCAETQMRLVNEKSSKVENEEIKQIEKPVSPVKSSPQPIQQQQQQQQQQEVEKPVSPVKPSPQPVQQQQQQQQQQVEQKSESGSNWGNKIIDSVKNLVNEMNAPKEEKFPYPNELTHLVGMGFDETKSKASLLKHKGNINEALNEMC